MWRLLTGVLGTLFIAGCATTHGVSSQLFRAYSQYRESVDDTNLHEVAERYFSQPLLGEKYATDADATDQLLFMNDMVVMDSHYEESDLRQGCLTINGYDERNAPLIFSLNYVLDGEQWLINKINVIFIETPKEFSKEAKCPDEYVNET